MTISDVTTMTTVSGELRQSLQVILIARDLLARGVPSSEEQVQLTLIKGAVMRMAATLDRLPATEMESTNQPATAGARGLPIIPPFKGC